MTYLPLVVDLDGTLIGTDMLHESALRLLRDNPFAVIFIPYWLSKGKATLKQALAIRTEFCPETLPYSSEFLDWLKQQKMAGRKLILCTASDQSIASRIANYLGLFEEVISSNGKINLAGKHKAEHLIQRFGQGGFDYAGNSRADLEVWRHARKAILVNAAAELEKKAKSCCEIEKIFPQQNWDLSVWRRMLRVHQWMKNVLLFVPIFAAHQLTNPDLWLTLLLAFFSFSLCASAVYIANDLTDLESDRLHPRKRTRPFASGRMPVSVGTLLAPLLLLGSLGLASQVNHAFLPWLAIYFLLTCTYSLGLKQMMLIDCLTLAILYTLRIIAGAAAIGMPLSFWLLAFSVFLFLSLAFVKRYAELEVKLLNGEQKIHGRGYYTTDAPLIQTLGVTSGYAAVLVLALYLNSDAVSKLYRTPEYVWGAVPVTLFWISWMWMKAHRGQMHDDPLVFALKDKTSLLAGLAFGGVMGLGTLGGPW